MKTIKWIGSFAFAILLLCNAYEAGIRVAESSCTVPSCDELIYWWNAGGGGLGADYGHAFSDTHAYQAVLSAAPLGGTVSFQAIATVDRYTCDIDNACNLGQNQPDPIKWYEGALVDFDSCELDDTYLRQYCGTPDTDGVPGSWY